MTQALEKLNIAKSALAEAKDIHEILNVRDAAMATAVLAEAKGAGEVANEAKEVQLRAERKAGQWLGEHGPKPGNPQLLHDETIGLDDLGINRTQSHRWQTAAAVPDEDFEELINSKLEAGKELTSKAAYDLGRQFKGRPEMKVHYSSESNEWYTPTEIIDRVLGIMGAIDLDPCSNSKTDPSIPASNHFTKDDDGLSREWFGRVYMNPPYGRKISVWVNYLAEQYEDGNVREAVALIPARTDTQWYRRIKMHPRCFIWGRLSFNDKAPAPFPSMAVYFGDNLTAFVDEFSDIGDVYVCITRT